MLRPVSIGSIDSRLLILDTALVPELGVSRNGGLGGLSNASEHAGSFLPPLPIWNGIELSELTDGNLFPLGQLTPFITDVLGTMGKLEIPIPRPIDLGAVGVNVSLSTSFPSPAPVLPSQTPVVEVSVVSATLLDELEEATPIASLPVAPVVDAPVSYKLSPGELGLVPVAIPPTPPDFQAPNPLASYRGDLSAEDDYNPQRFATFKDDYSLNVGEDSMVQFSLISTAFDTYLQLLRFDSDEVFVFDDDSGQGHNSQLSLQVTQGDRFIVRVTSNDRDAIGHYHLNLTSDGYGSVTLTGEGPGGNNSSPPLNPLPVDGNLQPNPEQFNPRSGYGLVNAADAVAAALSLAQPELTEPFAEAPDLGGFDRSLDRLRVPEAWAQGFTGSGVTVAVIDSGLDSSHPELQERLWINSDEIAGDGLDNDQNGYIDDVNGWNFGSNQLNNNIAPGTDSSFQGHGTHVAGIIAGANDGRGNTGVAYDAKIMPLRLGDINNAGLFLNPGNLATAVRYAVDNGANVINLSLGWPDSPALRTSLEYAADNNVVVVGASGNSGFSTPVSPARYAVDWGLSVGAVTTSGRLASFSNGAGSNSEIRHVLAPGNGIVSAEPGGGYETRTGTSMAVPYVSGVVALMLSANPSLTNVQVRNILAATADSIS